jgi:hypothetical protein
VIARVAVAVVLLLGAVGCGGHAANKSAAATIVRSRELRSVADVKAAFAHHGIRLVGAAAGATGNVRDTEMFGTIGDLHINVDVYRKVPRYYSVLLGGSGKTHSVVSRNVVAAWRGHDSRSVRAAMKKLR